MPFENFKQEHGGVGPLEYAYSKATGGVGLTGNYGLQRERSLTDQMIEAARNDPDVQGLDAFLEFGASTKMTREQHAAYRSGLGERVGMQKMAGAGFEVLSRQLQSVKSFGPQDDEQLAVFSTRLDMARLATMSMNPEVQAAGYQQLIGLGSELSDFSAKNEEQQIAVEAVERHQEELAYTREQTIIQDSRTLRDDMYSQLDPLQDAMGKLREIADISEVDSPMALIAVAYDTVRLLQGPGIISESDLEAAQAGLTTWHGWLLQKMQSGTQGKGFTAEARNNLLKVLEPLAATGSRNAAQLVARYNAQAESPGYRKDVIFAGFDPKAYDVPAFQYSDPNEDAPGDTGSYNRDESEPSPWVRAPDFADVPSLTPGQRFQRLWNRDLRRQPDESLAEYDARIRGLNQRPTDEYP